MLTEWIVKEKYIKYLIIIIIPRDVDKEDDKMQIVKLCTN